MTRLAFAATFLALPAASFATSFDFTTGADGWTAGDCASAQAADGAVTVAILCLDGSFDSPPLQVDAAALPVLEVVMAANWSGPVDLEVTTGGQAATIRGVFEVRGDQQLHAYSVALGAEPAWTGAVTKLRLVFPRVAGTTAMITRIALRRALWAGTWAFEADAEGWTAAEDLSGLAAAGGALAGTVLAGGATKPRIESPPALELPSRDFRALIVEVAATSPAPAQKLRVWWGTTETPSLNVSRSMTLDYTADGAAKTLRFDVAEHAKWRGTITTLWLQPFVTPEAGATFAIESLGFAPRVDLRGGRAPFVGGGVDGLRIGDGALRGVVTGASATLTVPMDAPLAPYTRVAVTGTCLTLSYSKAGGGGGAIPVTLACDGQVHTAIADMTGWSGKLTALTLTVPKGAFAVERLALLPPGPSFELASVTTGFPQRLGDASLVTARVENRGGDAASGAKVIIAGGVNVLDELAPLSSATVTNELPSAIECTTSSLSVTAQLPGAAGTWTQTVTVNSEWLSPLPQLPPEVPPPGAGASSFVLPKAIVLQNDRVRLAVINDPCLGGFGELRLFTAANDAWLPVGGRVGLGRLVAGPLDARLDGAAALPTESLEDGFTLPLTATVTDEDGVKWSLEWRFSVAAGSPFVDVVASATPDADRGLWLFTGPAIEVGLGAATEAQGALLGGLELLGPGQPSSSNAAIVGPDARRDTPHAMLVGLPLMAIAAGGATVGLVWNPAEPWTPGNALPALRFQTPDRDAQRPSHRLELRAPSAPVWIAPGDALAAEAYPANAGVAVTLHGALYAAAGEDLGAAARAAAARLNWPTTELSVPGETGALLIGALTQGPGPGWVTTEGEVAAPHADVLAAARRLAVKTGDAALSARVDAAALATVDLLAGTIASMEAPWLEGRLPEGLDPAALFAESAAVSAAAYLDGAGVAATVGAARLAARLLRYARLTGSTTARAKGLAALAPLSAATLPLGGMLDRGVPSAAPDLATCTERAAAELEAFRLTGEGAHLAEARRWASLSLAFVRADFGVVAAFGARHYTQSLLGVLSAEQGLRLGVTLRDLGAHDASFAWAAIGTNVVDAVLARLEASGLVREGFDLRDGAATGPLVLPWLAARRLAPGELSTAAVQTPGGPLVHVTSAGEVTKTAFSAKDYAVVATVAPWAAGRPTYATFGNLPGKPASVSANGAPLAEAASLAGVATGWRWDASLSLLALKLAPDAAAALVVPFPVPDGDKDGFPANVDCDDTNDDVFPGAQEVCNGVDDDCDLTADEDTGMVSCGVGQCAHSEPVCQGGAPGPCHPEQGATSEVCDSVDNDCDGDTDEDVGLVPCGVGGCTHLVDACDACNPLKGATDEVCDGVDNDCDGTTDESPGTIYCGLGACEHLLSVCDVCEPMVGATGEVCNLIDDDCDGVTDEDLPTVPCGTGQCLHDIPACAPCNATKGAGAETCDGVDNDCDGETDEGSPTKDCGIGACARQIAVCVECDPVAGAAAEVCDGVDNDCNGETDDALGKKPCGTGQCYHEVGACAACDEATGAGGEVCDGQDNDCDGTTDELDGTATCGLGACAHLVTACADCDATEGALPEVCNAMDDDCDGETDEVADLGTIPCGMGQCAAELPSCTAGAPAVCDPFAGAESELCNGVDDDCDGTTDEDIGVTVCGLGECAHEVAGCVLAGPGSCDPLAGAAAEVCNGKDDDCDGETDEDLGSVTCGVSKGCPKAIAACAGGKAQKCDPLTGLAPESCNGEDDDCDGETDEDIAAAPCGTGLCLHVVPACVDAAPGPCDPLEGAAPEACNFADDDCDGETDEDIAPVTCGQGICQNTAPGCINGAPGPCKPLDVAKPDTCNGKDDNCNGEVDEGQGSVTCGKGACQRTVPLCLDGVVQKCDALTGAAPETCNGIDDDCNGETDEGLGTTGCGQGECKRLVAACTDGAATPCDPYAGSKPEVCDGKDNDCDGIVDGAALGKLTCQDGAGAPYEVFACQEGTAAACPTSGKSDADASSSAPPVGAVPGGASSGCQTGARGGGALLVLLGCAIVFLRRRSWGVS